MPSEKRPRGRPCGSGKNDLPQLAQVADLLLRDSSLKPTTAMKRVIRGREDSEATDATLLRRWQVKWKKTGPSLLEAARKRNAPKPSTTGGEYYYPRTATEIMRLQYERIMDQQLRIQRVVDEQLRFQRAVDQYRRMQDLIDPPYMRELRRLEELRRQLYPFNI
jgi:hypothetical protein